MKQTHSKAEGEILTAVQNCLRIPTVVMSNPFTFPSGMVLAWTEKRHVSQHSTHLGFVSSLWPGLQQAGQAPGGGGAIPV